MLRTNALLLALVVATPAAALKADFPLCGSGKRITCVVDGDTVNAASPASPMILPGMSAAARCDRLVHGSELKFLAGGHSNEHHLA